MKTLPLILPLLAAAFAVPSVRATPQIIQIDKPTTIEPARKKSAPKRAQPKPRPKAAPAPAQTEEVAHPSNAATKPVLNAKSPAPGKPLELGLTSFSAKGLNYETEVTGLYLGDFAHARLERDSMEFDLLFGNYLTAFAKRCDAQLPADKVEMTKQVCAREQYTVNGYGMRVGPSTCIEYRRVGTGLYADPELYAAQQQLDAEVGRDVLRDTLRGMSGNNPMGAAMRTVDAATSVAGDMDSLLALNACTSPGLKRFQENVLRFARGEQPLHLAGGETLASIRPRAAPGAAFKDSDYARVLEDLIAENARGWMMNRFVRGSVSGATVTSRDQLGRPSVVVGDYQFDGFEGRSKGSVRLEFSDGLPQCLYFFDFPTTCRSPGRRIITDYENGRYQE